MSIYKKKKGKSEEINLNDNLLRNKSFNHNEIPLQILPIS